MKVFFVFKQRDGRYTLWGKTTVQRIDDKLVEEGKDYEVGFAFIHFNPFEPLPRDKWKRNLTDVDLVGQKWLMGLHRYIDTGRESFLERLIEGGKPETPVEALAVAPSSGNSVLNIKIMPHIKKKLEEIAYAEGRQKDDIVREAIAEWLKGRET
jgi:hypothetical protein